METHRDQAWRALKELGKSSGASPGDRLSITCEHDNSRVNQPVVRGKRQQPRTVTWGEDSSDEMCVGFPYVSER